MAILNEGNRQKVTQFFQAMTGPVTAVLVHAPGTQDDYASVIREMLTELSELTPHLQWRELTPDAAEAGDWQLERHPALVLLDGEGRDRGVRFYSAPMGYEFMTLLEDLVDLSRNETRLSPEGRAAIQAIDQEVKIEVFTTPG